MRDACEIHSIAMDPNFTNGYVLSVTRNQTVRSLGFIPFGKLIRQPEAVENEVFGLFNDEIIPTVANHVCEGVSGDPGHKVG
jgi:hypothetical protein